MKVVEYLTGADLKPGGSFKGQLKIAIQERKRDEELLRSGRYRDFLATFVQDIAADVRNAPRVGVILAARWSGIAPAARAVRKLLDKMSGPEQ